MDKKEKTQDNINTNNANHSNDDDFFNKLQKMKTKMLET